MLSETTLQLLQCVEVPAGSGNSVLFHAGAVQCGAWQLPIKAFLALLFALPMAPLVIWGLCQLPHGLWLSRLGRSVRVPANSVAQALRQTLIAPFADQYWHWPALLALQRFVMVSVQVFYDDSITSSLLLAFIAQFMLLAQLVHHPYKNPDVNLHSKLAAMCLLGLAVLNIPNETLLQALVEVVGSDGGGADSVEVVMAVALLTPVLLPPLFVAGFAIASAPRGNPSPPGDHERDSSAYAETELQATSTVDYQELRE